MRWASRERSSGRSGVAAIIRYATRTKRSRTLQKIKLSPPGYCTYTKGRRMGLLDGKTAIITGSARGIGRATADLFSAEGARVTINDIDGDIAEQAAGEIKGETIAVSGDLTKPGACDDAVQNTT